MNFTTYHKCIICLISCEVQGTDEIEQSLNIVESPFRQVCGGHVSCNIKRPPHAPIPSACVQTESYRAEGLRVFSKGLGTTLSRAFVVNGVIFATYELCMTGMGDLG